jgi:hypothetical protein
VPIVKATIEGREYVFAPLKIKQMREIAKTKALEAQNLFETMDLWRPYLESSMKTAGNEMPDFEDFDIETGASVFTELIRNVMKASGVKIEPVGEAQPMTLQDRGMTSSAS